MIPKHLAAKFNINAILDKSDTERKTFLDKMLNDKANAEKFLDKHRDYLPQERIEALMEALQVLNTKIEKIKKSLPPGMLIDPKKILEQIGEVYDAKFEDGTNTSFAVVTALGLESLLGKEEILRIVNDSDNGSSNTNRIYAEYSRSNNAGILKNGYIVNLDLYQQVALLAAIEKKTGVNNKMGFYNISGGDSVRKTKAVALWKNKQISWSWTAEKYNGTRDQNTYGEAGVIYLNDQEFLAALNGKEHFCIHNTFNLNWDSIDPNHCNNNGAFVLGIISD